MAGRRGQANREAILAAAYEAIATTGYATATTAEICRRADVSSGTFFHYFPTKEDVLLALLEDPAPPSEATLAAIVGDAIDEARDPLLPAFIREIATLSTLPRVQATLAQHDDHRRARLGAAIAQERAAGRVRDDLDDDHLRARAEMVISGFETMLAAGADPETCATTMRGLLADCLGGSVPQQSATTPLP